MSPGHLQKSYLRSEEEKFIISPSTLEFRVLLIVSQGLYALLQRKHISDNFSDAECVWKFEMVSIGDENLLHEMSQPREHKSRFVHQQIFGDEWVMKGNRLSLVHGKTRRCEFVALDKFRVEIHDVRIWFGRFKMRTVASLARAKKGYKRSDDTRLKILT